MFEPKGRRGGGEGVGDWSIGPRLSDKCNQRRPTKHQTLAICKYLTWNTSLLRIWWLCITVFGYNSLADFMWVWQGFKLWYQGSFAPLQYFFTLPSWKRMNWSCCLFTACAFYSLPLLTSHHLALLALQWNNIFRNKPAEFNCCLHQRCAFEYFAAIWSSTVH